MFYLLKVDWPKHVIMVTENPPSQKVGDKRWDNYNPGAK